MRTAVFFLVSFAIGAARASNTPTLDQTFADHGVAAVGFDVGGNNTDLTSAASPSLNDKVVLGGTYATQPSTQIGSYNYFPSDLGIVRLLADGTRDAGFGSNGRVMLGLVPPPSVGQFGDLVGLGDGRVFYAGSYLTANFNDGYASGLLLGRLNIDGTPDATFHLDRVFLPDAFLSNAQIIYARRVKQQADGKIVILVIPDNPNLPSISVGIIRLMPNGAADPTFGHGSGVGSYAPAVPGEPLAYANDFALLPGGGLITAGPAQHIGGNAFDFGIAKIRDDGTLDPAFGTDSGWMYVAFDRGGGYNDTPMSVVIDSTGRILVVGFTQTDSATHLVIAKLLPNGQLDAGYGAGGRLDFPAITGTVVDAELLSNDRLLITMVNPSSEIRLVMLTRDGALEPDFGSAGNFMPTDLVSCGEYAKISNATRLVDGNLYLTGCHNNPIANPNHSSNLDFGFAKYHYESSIFLSSFEAGG